MAVEWERRSTEMERNLPKLGEYPVSGLVRRARRLRDFSQRELAKAAKLAQSTVAKVESGSLVPRLDVLQRLLAACDLRLVVVDDEGRVIQPLRDIDDTRDGAGRRYPAHLDTILDPRPGEWWADAYGLARPPETFWRDRRRRDIQRARSQWETRAARYRHAPTPMSLEYLDRMAEYHRERLARPIGVGERTDSNWYDVDEWDGDDTVPDDTDSILRHLVTTDADDAGPGDSEPEAADSPPDDEPAGPRVSSS